MVWPVAALAALILGFVIVYGSVVQARLEAAFRGAASRAPTEPEPDRTASTRINSS